MRLVLSVLIFIISGKVSAVQNRVFRPLSGCIDCFNFVAPQISGAENISPAEVGLIVYDTALDTFRGYTDGGGWAKLSSEKGAISISGSVTVTSGTDIVFADSTSGALTITLPTAAVSGKELQIKKISTALNVITIDGFSSETIDGDTTYPIVTKNEAVTLVADGANWRVTSHQSNTDRVSYSTSITGFGTVTISSFYWERSGRDMIIQGTFTAGIIGAVLASFTLPTGTSLETTMLSLGNTTASAGPTVGVWTAGTANPQRGNALTATGTSTTLIYAGGNSTPLLPVNGSAAFASNVVTAVEVRVPISGWKP